MLGKRKGTEAGSTGECKQNFVTENPVFVPGQQIYTTFVGEASNSSAKFFAVRKKESQRCQITVAG